MTKKQGKHPGGRPETYTKDLGLKICENIAKGQSIRTIVKSKTMPSSSTIFRWLLDEDKKEFWEQYERARNIQAELLFEEILEIADTPEEGVTVIEKEDSTEERKGDMLGHRRLKIDARKWYLSKVLPKKFGDKTDITSDGQPISLSFDNALAPRTETDSRK